MAAGKIHVFRMNSMLVISVLLMFMAVVYCANDELTYSSGNRSSTRTINELLPSTTNLPLSSPSEPPSPSTSSSSDKAVEATGKIGAAKKLYEITMESTAATSEPADLVDGGSTSTTTLSPSTEDDKEGNLPPSITHPSSKEHIYTEKWEWYQYVCKADGSKPIRFKWLKNGEPLKNGEDGVRVTPDGIIVFSEFKPSHNGYYQCLASNAYGTAVSDLMPLSARQMPGPGKNSTAAITQRMAYEPFSMECLNIPETVPQAKRQWYTVDQLKKDERIGINKVGTLFFAYLLPVDSGLLKCGLSSPGANQIPLFTQGQLVVGAREARPSPPSVAYVSTSVKAGISEATVLECFFYAYPVANITWLDNRKRPIKEGDSRVSVRDFGRQLVFRTVREDDEGEYQCKGTNLLGYKVVKVFLNVTAEPIRVEGSLTPHVMANRQDVTLSCLSRPASGEHQNTPIWYRNGQLLTAANVPDPARYTFSQNNKYLLIKNLDKESDTACFQCNVSNSEGYLFSNSYLRVIESITVTSRPPEVLFLDGEEKDLSVLATADSCCSLNWKWSHNGTVLSRQALFQLPFRHYDENMGRLFFNSSSVASERIMDYLGEYTCEVFNQHQSVKLKFVLSLPTDPKRVTSSSGPGLWWVGIVGGILAILVAVAVIVCILKSNYPRSTYMLEKQELKHDLNPEQDLLDQSFQEI